MRKIFVSLVVIAVLGSAYLAYDQWLVPEKVAAWDFIPKNSAVVLETNETLSTYDSIKTLRIWRALDDASFVKVIEEGLTKIDAIDTNFSIRKVFANSSSLIAFSPVSISSLGVLLVLKINSREQRNYLKQAVEAYKQLGYQFKTRNYNGFTIEEFYKQTEGNIFSFLRFQGYLIGSFSPFLVEDAIRTFNNQKETSFSSNFQKIRSMKPLDRDEGNVYLNLVEFNSMVNLFLQKEQDVFAQSAFLDINFKQYLLKLTGFTFPKDDFLSTFSSGPGSFNLLDVIPNNTANLAHYSFQDAKEWRTKLRDFDSEIEEVSDWLKSEFDVNTDVLFDNIHQEIGVADLEAVGSKKPDRLIFFNTNNVAEVSQFLRRAAIQMATDSTFSDKMGDYVLRKLNVEIARALLGNRSALDNECYYTLHREYVIMSNSPAQLKRLIQSIESDNTWRKSLQINKFLNFADREANYSLFMNVPRGWDQLLNTLKPSWKPFFEKNKAGLKSLEYLSLQFSKVDDKFYTSAVVYQPEYNLQKQRAKKRAVNTISLASNAITRLFLIKNHVNPTLEILTQDSALQLYHISSDFNILWTSRLSEPIVGSIEPVDFYQNNKTQYVFCTTSQLHILDRTGASIEGYPITLSAMNPITHFSVVDYDGSKNYRFMITDSKGNIYLLDKSGELLTGWNPKSTGSALNSAPRHIRVAGKDVFIMVNKKGVIDLLNRRGTSYPGFPLDLKSEVVKSYFTETSGSFETSKITTLTNRGEILRINFSGRIEHRKQLFKPDATTTFAIVPDALKNTFVILRSSDNLWEVLDDTGAKIFSKTSLKNDKKIVQYYRFSGGRVLFLVTEVHLGTLTIYEMDGNRLTQKSLRSSNPVNLLSSEDKNGYILYLSYDNVIEKISVK